MTTLGSYTLPTFSLYLALAICTSIVLLLITCPTPYSRRAVGDVGLAILTIGFAAARLEYVLLNWQVFEPEPLRVFSMATGGLDWHGAFIGGMLGGWVVARLRGISLMKLIPALSPVVPLLAFAGWAACRGVGCVYGVEVETLAYYPSWLVVEGRDIYGIIAPRYDTHRYGMALSWVLWVFVAVSWISGRRSVGTFWWVVLIFCGGMFGIGFLRGDNAPTLWQLRADQWLDLVLMIAAFIMLLHYRFARSGASTPPHR